MACLLAGASPASAKVGFRFSLTDSSTSCMLMRPVLRGITSYQDRPIVDVGTGARDMGVSIDSAYSEVTCYLRNGTTNLLEPTILSYSAWAALRKTRDLEQMRADEWVKGYKVTRTRAAGEGLAIDLPYRIRSKTFRRLFGGENVGVRVQGNVSINGSMRRQKLPEMGADMRSSNTAFNIDMTQRFTITGKVGQKVEVRVDQDSERLFDFQNNLMLTYTGDEDEIVQKVEAGNVSLNLGTRLATFSGRNQGLFGLKTEAKLGALKMTGIASLERGQKNRQTATQATEQNRFDERQYKFGEYFWITAVNSVRLDSVHGDSLPVGDFRESYRHFQGREHQAIPTGFELTDIDLYVSTSQQTQEGAQIVSGTAAALQFYPDLLYFSEADFSRFTANHERGLWRQLNRNDNEYEVDYNLGFIRLRQPLRDGEALACAFRTARGDTFGTQNPAQGSPAAFVLLWPRTPNPTDSTWNLMFRHVYSLQATDIDRNSFKLTIIRKSASGPRDETDAPAGFCGELTQGCSYVTFFDFDREGPGGTSGPDGYVDNLSAIINYERGELCFLDLTPFNPSGYWNNGVLTQWRLDSLDARVDSGGFLAPYLYDQTLTFIRQQSAKWQFNTEFKGSASEFRLGLLVLEGSEEVTLNGQRLERGVDYTIDYGSGVLRILNEAAKAAGANLEITYESGKVFQLDKTTLLGARAEYGLWQDSHIGAMLLYLNQKTLDRRVRIGSEPLRNTLWDMDASLRFKPDFLTRMVDAIPLVRTQTASDIQLDGEVARVYPNPNSLENQRTGDYNGLAFLDDFEGSRRATPLGLQRRTWSIASIPLGTHIDHRRGRLWWYNPIQQVPVADVFPERQLSSQVANTLQSLVLRFQPTTDADHPAERSWGGVMRYLGEGYADQSQAKYLEFWVRLPDTTRPNGKLIVDLGTISEDALPNDTLDTEDQMVGGGPRPNPTSERGGDGILQDHEDTGTDGKFGSDPSDTAYWDGPDQPPIPSWDDWVRPTTSDYSHVNGTEHSKGDESGGYPDTEDLNNNDNLDITNAYYEYEVDLRAENPYVVGGQTNRKGWRLFRIPVDSSDVRRRFGNADLRNIRWARIYLTGISNAAAPTEIQIVQMDIVSNEWLPVFTATDSTEHVSVAVINTEENPGYKSPPGVSGEEDPITNLLQREQSLVLKINEIRMDGNAVSPTFLVAKNLYEETNLLEYRHLKMFIHGGGISAQGPPFPDNTYQLVFRLGQNYGTPDDNYYDIITTVRGGSSTEAGWEASNHLDILLNNLADLNRIRADSGRADSLDSRRRFALAYLPQKPADSLVVSGSPSLSRIGFLALGVRTINKYPGQVMGGDEIWVDELRVSDIRKDAGTAAEMNATVQLADFIKVVGGYKITDANFHNVNLRVNPALASESRWRTNVDLDLHKVYLERFGVQVPMTLNYNEVVTTPLIIPNTDTRIDPKSAPDSIKTITTSLQYTVRYSKSAGSKNPFVRWTLEKLGASYSYSRDVRSDYNIAQSRTEQSTAQTSYSLPISKGKGVAPLWFTGRVPVLGDLKEFRLYYLPTKLTLSAGATKRTQYQRMRSGTITPQRSFATSRTVNTGLAPFGTLSMDYTRTHRALSAGDWLDLLKYDFGQLTDITQTLTNSYSPELLSWFKPSLNYSATYTWANGNFLQEGQQRISIQRSSGADVTLDFGSILGGGGGRRGRDRGPSRDLGEGRPRGEEPGHPPGRPSAGPHLQGDSLAVHPDSTQAATDTTKAKPPRAVSPLKALAGALTPLKAALMALDPVVLQYDNTAGHSQSGTVGQAPPAYQFGFSLDPRLPLAPNISSIPVKSNAQTLGARSGLRFTSNLRSSFNWSYRASENVGNGNQGQVEQNMFWLGGKKGKKPFSMPFVDVTLDWTGLERIKFLSTVTKSVSLQSGISQKLQEQWRGEVSNVTQRTFTRGWNPLLGVNLSWKGDIDSQVRYGITSSYNEDAVGNKSTRSEQTASGTVSYTIRTGFKLPLLLMRPLRLQNQTTFSLNLDYSSSKTEANASGLPDQFSTRKQNRWSLTPRMSYSFSNTVQGEARVLYQASTDEAGRKSRVFEFGIRVDIAIRG